jgi:hypothetical protein
LWKEMVKCNLREWIEFWGSFNIQKSVWEAKRFAFRNDTIFWKEDHSSKYADLINVSGILRWK